VAAVDELTAAEAIERIVVDFEPLPFAIDLLDTLRPDGPNTLTDGNIWVPALPSTTPGGAPPRPQLKTLKWTAADFANAGDGQLPMGDVPETWAFGDLDAGFKDAALVLDELGIGHAYCQKWAYDPHDGVPLAVRFHHTKPPSILDVPRDMQWEALNIPDPETPLGARGVGEPPVGAGVGAVMNAILDAVGPDAFRRSPATADILLMTIEHGRRRHEPLRTHL
jgi:CO/xanthine dehydrogenase Mo-binding subunit